MSKFKVGDRVRIIKSLDNIPPMIDKIGQIMTVEKVIFGDFYILEECLEYYIWQNEELELYKTPHERLLELGFNFWDNSNGLQYNRKEIEVLIDKETKTYKIYWVVDDMAFSVDLELSKILTQYLEELE